MGIVSEYRIGFDEIYEFAEEFAGKEDVNDVLPRVLVELEALPWKDIIASRLLEANAEAFNKGCARRLEVPNLFGGGEDGA